MAGFHFVGIIAAGLVAVMAPRAGSAQELRKPSMPESMLIHKVSPKYPAAAMQQRIQGTVRFSATIGKDGHVERLRLISGHPLLAPAAKAAVEQWVYRPTVRGGEAVRVRTQIEVGFFLDGYGRPVKEGAGAAGAAVL
ncbi:MAG TPA: energy transducer TonB [Bryobacteraceae bacterium]|nr:energy transducer TonB [Bryobacteraceae bacterium]